MCTAFTLRSGISSFWIPLGFMWFINAGSDFLFLPLRWFRSNYLFIFFKFTWTNEAKRLRYKDIVFISASEWILLVYYLEISDLTFFTFFYLYICLFVFSSLQIDRYAQSDLKKGLQLFGTEGNIGLTNAWSIVQTDVSKLKSRGPYNGNDRVPLTAWIRSRSAHDVNTIAFRSRRERDQQYTMFITI